MTEIPKFESEDAERAFWAEHNSTDFLKSAEEVTLEYAGKEVVMTEQFDLSALEKALSKKERVKKEVVARKKQDKPLLVVVDKEGKEVDPKDIKEGKVYGLKQNS